MGATLGIHVVEIRDLPLARALQVAEELGRELEQHHGQKTRVGNLLWAECEDDEAACVRELCARDDSAAVILLRFFETPNTLLITALRARADGAAVLNASAKLRASAGGEARAGAGEERREEIAELARALFPDLRATGIAGAGVAAAGVDASGVAAASRSRDAVLRDPQLAPPRVEPPPSGPPWLLIGGLGAGAVFASLGVVFESNSRSAQRELLAGVAGRERIDALGDRRDRDAVLAIAFFSAAVLSAGASIALEVIE